MPVFSDALQDSKRSGMRKSMIADRTLRESDSARLAPIRAEEVPIYMALVTSQGSLVPCQCGNFSSITGTSLVTRLAWPVLYAHTRNIAAWRAGFRFLTCRSAQHQSGHGVRNLRDVLSRYSFCPRIRVIPRKYPTKLAFIAWDRTYHVVGRLVRADVGFWGISFLGPMDLHSLNLVTLTG